MISYNMTSGNATKSHKWHWKLSLYISNIWRQQRCNHGLITRKSIITFNNLNKFLPLFQKWGKKKKDVSDINKCLKGKVSFFAKLENDHRKADMLSEDWNVKWGWESFRLRLWEWAGGGGRGGLWCGTGVVLPIEQSLLLANQPFITTLYPANHI